ncbi:MAG: prepilin-type N-terminal cleavage/methylation domain-containing protein [Sulfurospirillaceae bacterium]|nr:prepilin-type N-terminal cleavage/methylation domain-containing protein [Sulfurospirillaceae bacterium]
MKKGFTMIELIFVIVILGILAAVAIPRLAATRDDAKLAAVKTDIGTFMNAIPAWYQGQKDARIAQATSIDTNQWVQNTGVGAEYTLTLDNQACVTIAVWDVNGTTAADAHVATTAEINATNGAWQPTLTDGVPVFRVINAPKLAGNSPTGICGTLWNDMGVQEANITMAGQKVKW